MGNCGIEVKDYDEARVMPKVTVNGQVQDSRLGLELLDWAVVQNG